MRIQFALGLSVFLLVELCGFVSNAAPSCEILFAAKQSQPTLSLREKLFELAKAVSATPIQQRTAFRHKAYTESANGILDSLRALEESIPEGATVERRAEIQFAHAFISHLRVETEKRKAGGDVPADWALRLGFHASNVATLLKKGVDYENGQFGPNAFLDPTTMDYSQTQANVQAVFKRFETSAIAQPLKGITQIPTTQLFTMEGVVRLLAVGIHTVGTNLGDDPSRYFLHDVGHGAGFIRAIVNDWSRDSRGQIQIPTDDIAALPAYARFKSRLQKVIDEVDKQPQEQRHAAFAFLFFLFHESPDVFLPAFVEPTVSIFHLRELFSSASSEARYLLRNYRDMGYEFLPGFADRPLDFDSDRRANEIAKRGASIVLQALTMTYYSGSF